MDATAKSKAFGENLGDKELDEAFAKVSYAAVVFEKGSDEAKKRWKEGKADTRRTANEGADDTSAEAHARPCK